MGSGDDVRFQLEVLRAVLGGDADGGFALAGSNALRHHGLTSRVSNDIDLFLSLEDEYRSTPSSTRPGRGWRRMATRSG